MSRSRSALESEQVPGLDDALELMLASIVVYGLSQNTFDLVQIGQSSSDWIFAAMGRPRTRST